jgi:hypothetical protein
MIYDEPRQLVGGRRDRLLPRRQHIGSAILGMARAKRVIRKSADSGKFAHRDL